MAKVQISIDDDLLHRADMYADSNYMSRSGLITLCLAQYLNSNDVIRAVQDMAVSMRKIADTGKIDHETMEELEEFERICKVLVNGK